MVADALTGKMPKTRYTVTPTPIQNQLLNRLPKRLVDRMLARRLGLLALTTRTEVLACCASAAGIISGEISVDPWISRQFTAARLAAGECILNMSAKHMHTFLIACSTSLLLASGTAADAQSRGREPRDPSKIPSIGAPDEILKRGAEYLEQCMKDWDAATHMSKQDWRRTCQRVSQDRAKFMLDQAKKDSSKK